jgi:polygalacturonase
VTGTIRLHDNTSLQLDRGATLLGSLDPADYHVADASCGVGNSLFHGHGLIVANRARHVEITGRGVIDGRGGQLSPVWPKGITAPFLCRWFACDDVSVTGVTFTDPGSWVEHFFRCQNVRIDRVTVRTDQSNNANTDGIDVDSCQNVRITRCDVSSGDDAICLKTTCPVACRDVEISDCRLSTRCSGVKFGTESVGPFEHIRVSRCQMNRVGMAGIAIYSVDGSDIRDVTITDVRMRTVRTPIAIRLGSRLATYHPGERRRSTGSIDGITIRGVRASDVEGTGVMISGIPERAIGAVTLEDVRIGLTGGVAAEDAPATLRELVHDYPQDDMFGKVLPASGLFLRHVHGLSVGNDVTTETDRPDGRPIQARVDVGM